jgi:hypothetical protein
MNRLRLVAVLVILGASFGGNPRPAYALCMDNEGCSSGQVCYEAHCRTCVLPGDTDDVLYQTNCCSGQAVPGSAYCNDPADWGTTWASCYQTCA